MEVEPYSAVPCYTLLQESGVADKTVYLDIRGNHDTFDVSDHAAAANMFASHSRAGAQGHASSYVTTVTRRNTSVAFVAMDASLNPGPKKVYNFLGHLTEARLEQLVELKAEAEKSDHQVDPVTLSPSSPQVYFGHFPLSCIVPSSEAKALVSRHP